MSWRSRTVFHLIFFLTFLISGLCINVIQALGYLFLPKNAFRRLNYYLQWSMYSQFIFLFDWWSGSEVRLYGPAGQIMEMESLFGSENALILCNHHYETDWLFGWVIAERFNVLGGAKVFMKAVLKYVPVLGWGWALSDIIYVKRDWVQDQKMLPHAIKRLEDYPYPFWLLIFAEGTRYTKEKYEACMKFKAKANDPALPDLKHHLIPRLKGFYHTLINLDVSKVPAIYDVTIVANKGRSSLSRILSGSSVDADIFVRRIPLKGIEKKEDVIKSFLMRTYEEKDALIEGFLRDGHFGNDSGVVSFPKRRMLSLVNVLALNFIVLVPCFYYVVHTFIHGSLVHVSLLVAGFSLLYFSLKKMIGITKVRESSAYGGGNNKKSE